LIIDSFTKQNFFLSNFFYSTIYYDHHWYPTVEHAYQAQKTLKEERIPFFSQYELHINGENLKEISPNEAKKRGRKLTLRKDWEKIKVFVMEELVYFKFHFNSNLRKKLIDTGDAELIEGNWWNDTEWGQCRGVGKNYLGIILMGVRKHLC